MKKKSCTSSLAYLHSLQVMYNNCKFFSEGICVFWSDRMKSKDEQKIILPHKFDFLTGTNAEFFNMGSQNKYLIYYFFWNVFSLIWDIYSPIESNMLVFEKKLISLWLINDKWCKGIYKLKKFI